MEKGKPKVQIFDTEEEVSISLAKYIAHLSHKFVAKKGRFTVVLSGGDLIQTLRKLIEPPYLDSIDWAKWHIFWLDERVVGWDDADSNYKLAYDGFLSKVPILPEHVYAIDNTLGAQGAAEAAADDYEARVKQLAESNVIDALDSTGFARFDLMLLGMGPDGHVASLFPGHPLLNEKVRWVTYILDSPKPPPKRITFTFPMINSSACIAMVVTGAAQADILSNGLVNENQAEALPFQRVVPVHGETTWFLDEAAASKLPKPSYA